MLLESIKDELKNRLKKKSLLWLIIVGFVLVFSYQVIYDKNFREKITYTAYYLSLTINGDRDVIPMSDATIDKLEKHITGLENDLKKIMHDVDAGNSKMYLNAWTLSQIYLAINSKSESDSKLVSSLIKSSTLEKDIKSNNIVNLLEVTWSLLALTKAKQSIPRSFFDVILKNKNNDGGWAVYTNNKDEYLSSTYITAFVVLSLHKALPLLVNKPEYSEIEKDISLAINDGVSWLSRNIKNGMWKDYPNNKVEGAVQKTDTAISLHVLKSLNHKSNIIELDLVGNNLIRKYSSNTITPLSKDVSGLLLWYVNGESYTDQFKRYTLPWFFIAYSDAYEESGWYEKTQATSFVDNAINSIESITQTLPPDTGPWVIAENLIGFKYLLCKSKKYKEHSDLVFCPK